MTKLEFGINQIVESSKEAFATYKKTDGKERALFLRLIGEEIMNLGEELVQTVISETHLHKERIVGERGRTVDQLNKFADLVEEGSWKEATIDIGDPDRLPISKPDLRKLLIPTGTVVVFGAGNFPLAFSVAGGDTASALAAGNPVIVKGHPAHPETSQLVARAIQIAVEKSGLHEGVFNLVQSSDIETGKILVQHPLVKGVGFTGSTQGGFTLVKLAAERECPIPVFAEMGSINPVVIFEDALKQNYDSIASRLVASVNLGAGQFCTNPGLIVTTRSKGFDEFVLALQKEITSASGSQMFSEGVYRNYTINSEKMLGYSEVRIIAKGSLESDIKKVNPAIAMVSATDFMQKPQLHAEVFGPFSLLVVCNNRDELKQTINCLEGQLTATIHVSESELHHNIEIIEGLKEKCGRLLFNGVPTGVEVCAAMHHGGPFPATSDSRFTSVGMAAIKRFVRPLTYQDFPQELLPEELQDGNPLNIWRLVNDNWTKDSI